LGVGVLWRYIDQSNYTTR